MVFKNIIMMNIYIDIHLKNGMLIDIHSSKLIILIIIIIIYNRLKILNTANYIITNKTLR